MKTIICFCGAAILVLGLNNSALANNEFSAKLSGGQQVRTAEILDASGASVEIPIGPLVTGAHGKAHFMLSPSGDMLHYQLEASGFGPTMDVTQAHIHLGPKGANGPPIFFLYRQQPPPDDAFPGTVSGVLTAADLLPLANSMGVVTFADAVANIMHGNTYVNLHTTANPAGEIRGQIKMHKHRSPPFGNKFPFGKKNSPFGPGFPFER